MLDTKTVVCVVLCQMAQSALRVDAPTLFSELIDQIYAASTDPSLWPTFLEHLAIATRSIVVPFIAHDFANEQGSCFWHFGLDDAVIAEYQYWAPQNPFMKVVGPTMALGSVVPTPMNDPQVGKSSFFNEFVRQRLKAHHSASLVLAQEQLLHVAVTPLRAVGAPDYSDGDMRLFKALVPHLQRAMAVHRRLASVDLQRLATSDALDRLPTGIVILDQGGHTLFVNQLAQEILDQKDGLSLGIGGTLVADRSPEASSLKQLVGAACQTGCGNATQPGGGVLVSRRSGRAPFSVLVSPLRVRGFLLAPQVPAAVVFLSDPEHTMPSNAAVLRQLYDLTPAESEVTRLLLQGRRVDDLTDELHITEATARTHVRRILDKTASRSQADLLRQLSTGAGALRLGVEAVGRAAL